MEHTNERHERIEELLNTRSFEELTPEEKTLVLNELGSEEEYTLLRRIGRALVSTKAGLSPDPKTLRSLQIEMQSREKHPGWLHALFFQPIPSYAVGLLLLGVVAIAAIVLSGREVSPSPASAYSVDTVYVKTSPDTVFVEKTIVKYVPRIVRQPGYTIVRSEPAPLAGDSEGVSMTEKEELETLLVSGS